MSDGGKGSAPRPFSDVDTYAENFSRIFGLSKLERRKLEEERAKREAAQEDKCSQRADELLTCFNSQDSV